VETDLETPLLLTHTLQILGKKNCNPSAPYKSNKYFSVCRLFFFLVPGTAASENGFGKKNNYSCLQGKDLKKYFDALRVVWLKHFYF
jgi:hypothetical protein